MKIKFKVNKLIRDKIPMLLEEKEIAHDARTMQHAEYIKQLKLKLLEEAQECNQAQSKKELAEELCDVMEVIYGLLHAEQMTMEQIEEVRFKKQQEKGGFAHKLYASFFEIEENNPVIGQYLKKFAQYPKNER